MTERFLQQVREVLARGRPGVLCQIVDSKGSTPQKPGAAMLVDDAGGQLGTLGGGCVEAQVRQQAGRCLEDGHRGAVVSDYLLDHDQAWADGLICGGRLTILSQRVEPGERWARYFESVERALGGGRGWTEAVVLDPAAGPVALAVGDRYLYGGPAPGATCLAATTEAAPPGWLTDEVGRPDESRRRRARVVRGVALLPRPPQVRLVIVGAGHVGQAVSRLASEADFAVWVVDDRRDCASAERFPEAQQRLVGPIGEILSGLELDPQTYALIVTRGHGHDQEALYHLAPTQAGYVGLIGSRRKIRLLFDAMLDAGVAPESLARVAAPVGLEIGSETVFEIAVSIVAELIARRNRGAGALVDRGWVRPDPNVEGQIRLGGTVVSKAGEAREQ